VAAEITAHGDVSLTTRLDLARKAFALTAHYDGKIATELERLSAASGSIELGERALLPERLHFALRGDRNCATAKIRTSGGALRSRGLRLFRPCRRASVARQELSYNNLVDLEAALELSMEFQRPAAVIVKHNNPAAPLSRTRWWMRIRKRWLAIRFLRMASDGFQSRAGRGDGGGSGEAFVECVVAPVTIRRRSQNFPPRKSAPAAIARQRGTARNIERELKRISAACSCRNGPHELAESDLKVVTRRAPTREETRRHALWLESLQAREVQRDRLRARGPDGWRRRGANESRRFRKIAVMKAQLPLAGALWLPTLFSFSGWCRGSRKGRRHRRDSARRLGCDPEVIAAADCLGIAMVFCGVRHFDIKEAILTERDEL